MNNDLFLVLKELNERHNKDVEYLIDRQNDERNEIYKLILFDIFGENVNIDILLSENIIKDIKIEVDFKLKIMSFNIKYFNGKGMHIHPIIDIFYKVNSSREILFYAYDKQGIYHDITLKHFKTMNSASFMYITNRTSLFIKDHSVFSILSKNTTSYTGSDTSFFRGIFINEDLYKKVRCDIMTNIIKI